MNIYKIPIEIRINPYGRDVDRRAIVEILDSYACDRMGGGEALSAQTRETLVENLEQRPWVVTLLAVLEEEAVGLLIAVEGFSTFLARPLLNLHDIAVVPAFRGRGVGTQLIHKAIEVGRLRGCAKLTLEVLEGNTGARALYRRLGFEPYQLDPELGEAAFWQMPIED
jgi:ribosomal protein S18 acetylase RimI-like enzyme